MALTAKLCNPTPWPVKLEWDRGQNIRIPEFGDAVLAMQQMDDYRGNKPGSEAVEEVLHYHGLFLLDSDRPYDNQALEALERARNAKKAQYDAITRNITDRRAAQGIAPNEEALEETFRMMGLTSLRDKIKVLEAQIKKYHETVGPDGGRSTRQQLDPRRTVFVLDPPREFPSVAAMEFFLEQNKEVKARHQALKQEQEASVRTETPVEVN